MILLTLLTSSAHWDSEMDRKCIGNWVVCKPRKEGRLIAFPNTMQHCVSGVVLKDKTKVGFRKMLVFFLVDPNKREEVLSTGRVQPQQRDWYPSSHNNKEHLVSLEQAKTDRENLMFSRKYYVVSQNERLFEREFSFCEH